MKTFCDFYAFRSRGEHLAVIEALRLALGGCGALLAHAVQPGGWHGYERHSLLNFAGVQVGLVAWGGKQQLGWVYASLSGAGCAYVESWDYFEAVTQALPEFSYRRVDLALDVHDGSCSHARTVEAYRAGAFDSRGHRPGAKRIEPEDRSEGCTFNVGKRKGSKYLRAYDKGCEIRVKSGMTGLTHIGGVRVEDLYRLEVEFKAVDGIELPEDFVRERDRYFAGAYPYLAEVVQAAPLRPFRIPRQYSTHADLTRGLASCKQAYGSMLLAAEKVYGGNRNAVWAQIVGEQISDRWIAAGAHIESDMP